MKKKVFLLILIPVFCFTQVKIGDNPSIIDSNSILELESENKVLVISRMNTTQMNALLPLSGALVYNTDIGCIHAFDGILWKNLCDNPTITSSTIRPEDGDIGDFWFNTANATVSLWNGTNWQPINTNPRRGSGTPSIALDNLLAGDIYVNQDNGDIYTYDGNSWIPFNQSLTASNGINITGNTIALGGTLTEPTVITTDSSRGTFAFQGLETTADIATNSFLVSNDASGVVAKTAASDIVQQVQRVVTASNGQVQFNTPFNITDTNKIGLYRNGVRVDFSVINETTIRVEPAATCFEGDEIRIVQLR